MDEFCGSPFWQHNLTWNITSSPDFTPCFQETVLIWIPCLLLWFFAPLEIMSIYRSERRYIPVTLLNLFKTFLSTVLCLLSVAELIEALTKSEPEPLPLVDYITPIVKSITYVLVFGLCVFHRNKGVHTSGLMLLFWFLMTFAAVINFRSLIRSVLEDHTLYTVADWHISELKFTVRIVATPIVIVQLVLACIADKKAQDPFMLTGDDFRNPSPENDASILSVITFWWLNSLMWLGYKRPLTQDDLYSVKSCDKTEMVSQRFDALLLPAIQKSVAEKRLENSTSILDPSADKLLNGRNSSLRRSWIPLVSRKQPAPKKRGQTQQEAEEQKDDETPARHVGVAKIIFKTFWPSLLAASFFKLGATLLTFASPVILDSIINFVSSNEPNWRGLLYAGSLFILSIIESMFNNREMYITSVNVMKIRTCITSAVYRKTLKLSSQGRKQYTTGEIVNIMSADTQKIAELVQNINSIWSGPVLLVISLVLLYEQLGLAVVSGVVIMVLNGPLNAKIALLLRNFQRFVMREKDKRVNLLSEIFNGIKVIKFHAWEEYFKKRTASIRKQEIKHITSQAWLSAVITFAFTSLPFLVAFASFATYVLMSSENVLDANKIFVSLALFNIMRIPFAVLPMILSNLSQYFVSIRRVNKFLECDETDPDAIKQIDEPGSVIKIRNGTFKWDAKNEAVLDKIDLIVPKGKLVAFVGPVGCGKSSLISSILGDLEKCDGEVMVDLASSIAYVPQEAWILNTTLRNNIMFNKVVNEDRYQRVIDACALGPDLKTLELGDQSEIGEKGLNLSGGQKQRVSLARAVYADTDIYLLDDPLNAVDAHVGRHIFDNIIGPKGMLRDRTRVLVTNKLSILPDVDHIFVMKDGQITENGNYEQLLKNRGLFSQLLIKYLLENSSGRPISEVARSDIITRELKRLEEKQALKDRETPPKDENLKISSIQRPTRSAAGAAKNGGDLTGREVTQVGSVGIKVHMNFVRTMGINFMIAVVIFVLSSVFTVALNLWLSDWSSDASDPVLRNSTQQRNIRLGVYGGLGLAESVCIITSTILLNLACLKGSQLLHNRMLARVLRAPMSWFNATPSGRIMNRFSKDIETVDSTIRFNVRMLMVVALRSVTSLLLISIGSVYSIIFLVPIVLLYFLFQIFYISTSRQLKRIESATKSPIYTHFTETIMGATSIRAFKVSHEFVLESNHRVDVNNASTYIGCVASRWLSVRLEILGFVVVLTASLIAVLSRGTISPGIAGLTVVYSLTVTQVLSFLVRTYSDYETNVVSVERLLEYTRTPVEPDDEEEPSDPNWPAQGEIIFQEYSTRYRPELDLVLKKINLKINPGERVGLVGRTGAGKSSITLSLFRILEATEGCIVIDDVNISQINLKVLRSKLSIIPQEPVMFTGTIRQNVDPTESHSDDEIWKALDLAHLGSHIRDMNQGLELPIYDGGCNFSVGQKQLCCLARTLLRRSKILVLDEATAAVDVETDNLIQQTIRKEFKNSTIITIAHRLETIQDYDRVVVMEDGTIAEQGSPAELLNNPQSKFYYLAKEAGITN